MLGLDPDERSQGFLDLVVDINVNDEMPQICSVQAVHVGETPSCVVACLGCDVHVRKTHEEGKSFESKLSETG